MPKAIFYVLFAILSFQASVAWSVTSDEYLNAGLSLYQKKQWDQSAQYLKAATQTDPKNWKAFQALGNCLYQQGKEQEALDAFDQSLTLHPDPATQNFADALRKKLGSSGPIPPPMPGVGAPAPIPAPGDSYAKAVQEAEGNLRYYNLNPQDHPLLMQYYEGKSLEGQCRASLKQADQSQLGVNEKYVELYGGVKSDFYDTHFTLMLGVLTPTIGSLDFGYFLNPTTNVGLMLGYIPLNDEEYQYSENDYGYVTNEQVVNYGGSVLYLEPRIKYYSAPSGLTTYYGFSAIYYGIHYSLAGDTNFDIFGLGYLFGFRTLPMDGMTMELGWKAGVAVLVNATYQYNYDTYTSTPTTEIVPFPYIIPEFRFGFTF